MFLLTGNFEGGLGAWRPVNYAANVTAVPINDPAAAKQGVQFMRFRTSIAGGSVAQDARIPVFVASVTVVNGVAYPTWGAVANSLQFSVWLRSAPGQANVQGVVALWDLNANVSTDTRFDVGGQWTQFSAGLDRAATFVRVEVYLNSVNQWVDVDAAVLV